MAPHSSVLAWRIPGTEEPGGLLSMGLHSSSMLMNLVLFCLWKIQEPEFIGIVLLICTLAI